MEGFAYAASCVIAFGVLMYIVRDEEPEGQLFTALILFALLWPLIALSFVGYAGARWVDRALRGNDAEGS